MTELSNTKRMILHRQRFKRIKPEEWVRRIGLIEDKAVRHQVACLVWWDWFGPRDFVGRWPHLDEYIFQKQWYPEIPYQVLYEALLAVGYNAKRATMRLRHTLLYEKWREKHGRRQTVETDNAGEEQVEQDEVDAGYSERGSEPEGWDCVP